METTHRPAVRIICLDEQPSLTRTGLLPDEQANLDTHTCIPWSDLGSLTDPVEPPQLSAVLTALAPDGPWSGRDRVGR